MTGGPSGAGLPALGRRGEGWFMVQVLLIAAVGVSAASGPDWSGPARIGALLAGGVLAAGGGLLALRGLLDLGPNLTVFPRPRQGARLVDSGAYALVRHPIYGGLVLGAVGWGLATASAAGLLAAATLAAFFTLKSAREEAWLVEQFPGYAAYRARTRRLVPWLF